MKRFRPALTAALLAVSASAWSASLSNLFVFGDSLSDPGNAYALSGGFGGAFPPGYGYPAPITRFTNGPTAAQVLAADLGVSSAGNYAQPGGPNYAVGGALAGTGNLNWLLNLPPGLQGAVPALQNTGVTSQVGRFAAAPASFAPASSLFMVWGGANDFFLWTAIGTPATLVPTAQASAGSIGAAIGTLYGLGAREFLVPNLPDLGAVPATRNDPQAAAAGAFYTGAYNATLAALLAQAQATLPGLSVTTFDIAGLLDATIAAPASFGFSNVTGQCAVDPAALQNGCAGYLFWDGVHPTAAGHAIVAAGFASALGVAVPLPGTLALLLAGALLLPLLRASLHAEPSKPFCRHAS